MAERKLIDGVVINLGGEDYTIPPLNFGQIKRLAKEIQDSSKIVDGPFSEDRLQAILIITLSALQRNYPDMTMEDLEEKLDVVNYVKVFQAIMGVSGFVQPGEQGPGESR